MKVTLRATAPEDEARLIAFLARAFSINPKSGFLAPPLLHWKYWLAREDFTGPRSYILERNDQIIAHAGVWPVVLEWGGDSRRGAHVIDWASDASAPGSGASILRRVAGLFDFVFAIGGTEIAQRVFSSLGFQHATGVWIAARPLKPLRQIFSHQHIDWRLPSRLARNAWWARIPAAGGLDGWTAVAAETAKLHDRLGVVSPAGAGEQLGAAFWRYVQACPAAAISGYQLFHHNEPQGAFVLSVIGRQARLVAVWLSRPSEEGLAAAYTAAQLAARRLEDAYEITASGSAAENETAAVRSGLRVRGRAPVYVISKDPTVRDIPLNFQFAHGDAFFLPANAPEFLT